MTSLQFEFRSPRKGKILRHKMRGFSLLEMVIVVAIGMILTGITFISLKPLLNQSHVNAAYDTTMMALRTYRSRAITERRRYIVAFTAPRTITISSWGVGAPIAPAPILVSTLTLPRHYSWCRVVCPPRRPQFRMGSGWVRSPLTLVRAWARAV